MPQPSLHDLKTSELRAMLKAQGGPYSFGREELIRRLSAPASFIVMFGEDEVHPLTVGTYQSRKEAEAAVRMDVTSPWHIEDDVCYMYQGTPGEDLKFIKTVRKKADLEEEAS